MYLYSCPQVKHVSFNTEACVLPFLFQVDRSGSIPRLRFRDRDSYSGNKTKEYDDLAMKYLSYVLFLLVACSSAYSLKYERHKSWYSWILSSLTSCVYMFGKQLNSVFELLFSFAFNLRTLFSVMYHIKFTQFYRNFCLFTASDPSTSVGVLSTLKAYLHRFHLVALLYH